MKKVLTIALSVMILLSVTACGNSAEIERLKKENADLKQQLSFYKNSSKQKDTENSEQKVSLNEPLTVNTESGSYKVTVTGAEIKDWRERSGGDITNLNVLLNYTVENIDFKNEYYQGCYVDSNFFYVYDDNNTLLNTASSSYDTHFPNIVLPGRNAQFNLCYDLIKDDTKYIDVVMHRTGKNGKDAILGQIQVDITN